MPVLVNCPQCSKALRIPDALLGQKVRCPGCQNIFNGQQPSEPPLPSGPPLADTLIEPGGRLLAPPTEGDGVRPNPLPTSDEPPPPPPEPPDDPNMVRCPGCHTLNPREMASCHECGYNLEPLSHREDDDARPWERSSRGGDWHPDDIRRDCEPHRGTLVLIMGILALVPTLCPYVSFLGLPFGIVAIVLGTRDLRKMNRGDMDPSGKGSTQAGQICGIVGTVLASICTLGWVGMILFQIVMAVTMGGRY